MPGAQSGSVAPQTLGTLFGQIWDSFSDTRKYAAFRNLIDLFGPLTGGQQPQFTYALRFPIASGKHAFPSMNFWMELCSIFARTAFTSVSFFCNFDDGDMQQEQTNPFLYVYFGQVPATGMFGLARYLADVESIYAIDSVGNRNPAELVLSIPAAIGRIIEDEHLTLPEAIANIRTAQ
jgi:hypothetical protein